MHKIIFLEKKDVGCTIKHISTNAVHLIPDFMLLRRVQWGIYELVNPEKIHEIQ